jgi:hypothetical protein
MTEKNLGYPFGIFLLGHHGFMTLAVGYNEFDFLKKIKNTDPLMGAKFESKTHLLITFLIFGAVYCAFCFKV